MDWKIGCSGFYYADWKDIFYPPKLSKQKWFEYYSSRFNTLEMNVTFYRFPQLSFLQSWYQRSPEGFCFSIKVPRLITHYKLLKETERELADFYAVVKEALKEKTGPVLFQFPPAFEYSDENLQRIINSVDGSFINVAEFRHVSWWNTNVYKQLADNNIVFCSISHPKLPGKIVANSSTVYYRFHGVPKLYSSIYSEEELKKIAGELLKKPKLKKVYVYFNNTMTAAVIDNVEWLINYVEGQSGIKKSSAV